MLIVAVLVEVAIELLLHPVNVADVRVAQAADEDERTCIVLGDSVANQLAPPNDGRALVRTLTGVPLPTDHRGVAAQDIDERCLFLTTTAGATRMADLLLFEAALRTGARPTEVHLLTTPNSWARGRRDNDNFEVGFVQRFSSPTAALSTFETARDPSLVVRQLAMGLPSVGARGPYGQRMLGSLVPRVDADSAGRRHKLVSWELSGWNEDALKRLAERINRLGATLTVHSAPYPEQTNELGMGEAWEGAMRSLSGVCVAPAAGEWPHEYYRDDVHMLAEEIPRLTEWFAEQLDVACGGGRL